MVKKMLLLSAVLLVAVATPASAGGWAVSTLDEAPAQLVAGQRQAIGFTIRQHGQTPVIPDSGEIGIRLTNAAGEHLTFLAASAGPVGHFVAAVEAPTAGTWQWEVLQGWFEAQPLGAIDVVAAGAASASPAASVPVGSGPVMTSAAGPEWWRIIAVGFASVLGLVFVVDLIASRRRHRSATAPA